MRTWLVAVIVLFSNSVLADVYFQYARFVEVTYSDRDRQYGILLSFSTDPGFPISTSHDGNILDARKAAYEELFKRAGWGKPDHYDDMYVLNVLGSQGWEIIEVVQVNETIFLERFPAKRREYLLKRRLPKANELTN